MKADEGPDLTANSLLSDLADLSDLAALGSELFDLLNPSSVTTVATGAKARPILPLPTQAALAEWLAGRLRGQGYSVSLDPGNPDRAFPAEIMAHSRSRLTVRARWVPQNLYRAYGFRLKLADDCLALSRQVERGEADLGAVIFIDPVGVVSPATVLSWRECWPIIQIIGWSIRFGPLAPPL